MPFKGPLPFTDRRRMSHFDPEHAEVHTHNKGKAKLIQKGRLIDNKAKTQKGMNLRLIRKAVRGMNLMKHLQEKKGMPLREIRIRQALLLDDMASDGADHAIAGWIAAGDFKGTAKAFGVETDKLNPAQIEKRAWEIMYRGFFKIFRTKHPESAEIIRTYVDIRRFTTVPIKLHLQREKRWKISIGPIEEKLLRQKLDPEKNLTEEISRVLRKRFSKTTLSEKQIARFRSQDLMIAASIYADIILETKGKTKQTTEEKTRLWDHSYSEAMEQIYVQIAGEPAIVEQVIAFAKERPKT